MGTGRGIVGTGRGIAGLLCFVMLTNCSPAERTAVTAPATEGAGTVRTGPKRITAAMMSDPPSISSNFVTAGQGTIQGGDALEDLVNAGAAVVDNRGNLEPQLVQMVPSVENGGWRIFPDGRMETTWRLRSEARWHDGTPFTTADLVFSAQLGQDRELPIFRFSGYESLEGVSAPDPQTVVVTWKQLYINADSMFTRRFAFPRPRHLLEPTYLENKAGVPLLPYWTDAYVGTGPFKLRQYMPGSHLVLEANEGYVLGRPKIDEIEVRFVGNPNTLVANLLAGQVQLTLGRNLQLSEAMQMRDQWREGTMGVGIKNWISLWVQFVNPNPTALLDVSFRRALLHAVDRQQLVDALEYGMVPVAHTFLSPTDALYREVETRIVKYDYDPRRSGQLIEQLGFTRNRDGVFQDAVGQPLALDVRTNTGHEDRILAIADAFKRVGIAAEPFIVPDSRRADLEYNFTYPGVRLWRLPNEVDDIDRLHSREAPMPENRWVGGNRSRYMNPAFDAMIDRFMSSVVRSERIAALGDIVHHTTDQLNVMGIYYNTEPVMMSKRLQNVTARDVGNATEAWNAHLWDLAP